MLRLLAMGVLGHMQWWTKHFLLNRAARVNIDGILINRTSIRGGVLQAAALCLQPCFSPISMESQSVLNKSQTHSVLMTLLSEAPLNTQAQQSIGPKRPSTGQRNGDSPSTKPRLPRNRTEKWGLTLNKAKTSSTLLSLSTKEESVK